MNSAVAAPLSMDAPRVLHNRADGVSGLWSYAAPMLDVDARLPSFLHPDARAVEMIPLARFIPSSKGWIGRPSKDRYAIACAFVAKAVYGFTTTAQLLERLAQDAHLRQICGWNLASQVPNRVRADAVATVRA